MSIRIPEIAVVALVGASGSGKSTFAKRHFRQTEILSSDSFRGWISDDENNQTVTGDAFDALYYIAAKRLKLGRLVVIDATNTRMEDRAQILKLARAHDLLAAAIVLDLPAQTCFERNQQRADRNFGFGVVKNQSQGVRRSKKKLKREGFRYVSVLETEQEIESATIERQKLWTDRRDETGPFDVIGDVHGCYNELRRLLEQLGYRVKEQSHCESQRFQVTAPLGRRAFFVGDLVDRGPQSADVLHLVMDMVESGVALCVPGNHEIKLEKKLAGKNVKMTHGLVETMESLQHCSEAFHARVRKFISSMVSHFVLDHGKLVVAHAGLKESYHGRASGRVRSFALFGETTGETDEYGLPVRHNWAAEYRGDAIVVYGHTPVPEPQWLNNTICVDTGCVFGGTLTAMRYPELELSAVKAEKIYYEPLKPLAAQMSQDQSVQQAEDEMLNIEDVIGKRHIRTLFDRTVIVREEQAFAAMEVISRFGVHPKWLNYLPPTMSPVATSMLDDFLEHPLEAFSYFSKQGVREVVCQQKHMGSRAVVQICRNASVAAQRFGIETDETGIVYTRTGRRFFSDRELEQKFVHRLVAVIENAGLFEELDSDWVTLDAELMPWSAKAIDLLRTQYAAVGRSASVSLAAADAALHRAAKRGVEVQQLQQETQFKRQAIDKYIQAYQHYCWPVNTLDDLRLAPFHLMASEGSIHIDKTHVWHMDMMARIAASGDSLFMETPYRLATLDNQASCDAVTRWWLDHVANGGEGMVVKPIDFVTHHKSGLVQPAVKVRGPEYLRIIYGPDYMAPRNIERLRQRSVASKRALAIREFSLGVESLSRFVAQQPLRRVHECVLGVLAFESEPIDPRL